MRLVGAVVVVGKILVTGGLHLDGLMDTVDGLSCGGDRERIRVVMKDSRVGAMGVLAAFSVLLIKVCLVGSLRTPRQAAILVLMPVLGRWVALLLAATHNHADQTAGLGRTVVRRTGRAELIFGSIACLLLVSGLAFARVKLGWAPVSFGPALAVGGILWFVAALAGLAMARVPVRRLGGITGDVIGAAVELAELAVLVVGVGITGVL